MVEENKISQIIKEVMKSKKITLSELSRLSGISKSSIHDYLSSKTVPKQKNIYKLAKALSISEAYLMGWETEPLDPTPKGYKIPVLGEVAAGIPIEAIENILDYEEIPVAWKKRGEFFGLQIKGNSMQPKMDDGDVVILRQQSDADTGDTVIAIVNGDNATCKKLKKTDNGLMLISTNPEYEPMFYTWEEVKEKPVTIIGKVVELRAKF